MRTQRMTWLEARLYVSKMARQSGAPECYLWVAKWWRLHARESKNKTEALRFSRSQMALYKDMMSRPQHYSSAARPEGLSDWQWSGLQ